jgi:hypothetical protein
LPPKDQLPTLSYTEADERVAISSDSSHGPVRYLVGGAARRPAKDTPPPDHGPGLDLTEPDSGVGGRPEWPPGVVFCLSRIWWLHTPTRRGLL